MDIPYVHRDLDINTIAHINHVPSVRSVFPDGLSSVGIRRSGDRQLHQHDRHCLHLFIPTKKPPSSGVGDNKLHMPDIVYRVRGMYKFITAVWGQGVCIGKNV